MNNVCLFLAISFTCLVLIVGCTSSTFSKKDKCPVPGLDWMEVSEDYNRDTVIKLAIDFEAAAKADAKQVKYVEDASAKLQFKPEFSNVVKKNKAVSARVSQEFFQQALAYRTSTCTLLLLLDGGHLSPTAAERAQQKLIDLASGLGEIKTKEEFEKQRARALLLGFDGAFAVAHAKMGAEITQDRAFLNAIAQQLNLREVEFPEYPLTDGAAPAAKFAQEVLGKLSAADTRLGKAFALGWVGVISINSPETTPNGFDLRRFASEAGFPSNADATDQDYLESLVAAAREEIGS